MRSVAEKRESRKAVCRKLDEMGIPYEMIEHEAAYTVEDMDRVGFDEKTTVCKNLFVRDQKKKATQCEASRSEPASVADWLVVLLKDKRADLDSLAEQLGTKHLSFASADRLKKHLGLAQGEVTPLGVLNDAAHEVVVVFDKDLVGRDRLGVHPNDNSATLLLSFEDIKRFVEHNGNTVRYVTLKAETA